MSLKNRFRMVMGVAMLGLLVLAGFWLTAERSRILSGKREKVKNLVETAHSILAECYQMQQHGMPQAEAQKQAIVLLKNLRYEGDNYFWINDFHPTMVMHPTKPQLDGTDLTGFKDPTGRALFVEMAATVRANGAGFVAYEWPRPGMTKPVPKISYVEGFAPWGWIVGTGVYVDDVDAIWRQSALEAAAIMTVLLVLMAATSISAYSRMFGPLQMMVACMKDVAEGEGDLTKRLVVPPDKEVAELAGWFNTFMEKVQRALAAVAGNVQTLAEAGKQIAITSRQQKQSAEQQQDQVCQVATAMKEMAATVQQISESSNNAAAASQKAADTARHGGEVVEATLSRMRTIADSVGQTAEKVQGLGKRSEEIGRIIRVIDDIADQTNLLALNAAIEAARAGDQGRGFAVVADEVRKLAERTSGATKEIAEMITKIQAETQDAVTAMQAGTKEVELGVESTKQAGCSLREIIQTSEGVGDMITQIAAAATEQSAATEQINGSVEQISKIAESASTGTQQSSKAIEELSLLASNLQQLVAQFRLESEGDSIGTGSGPAALRRKAAAAAR